MTAVAIRDWFGHSAFVLDAARREVNAQLDKYFADLRDLGGDFGGSEVTICVSGSLARGEPAVRFRRNRFGLASDVDLVAITGRTESDERYLQALVRGLRHRHPEVETTLFTMRRDDIHRVSGRFGVDLLQGARKPLIGNRIEFPGPLVGPREGVEGIVHQLALVYAPDNSLVPWRAKTVLEALRAVHAGQDGPQCYSHLATSPAALALLDGSQIEELIRAREYDLPTPITRRDAYAGVVAALCSLFGVEADASAEIALVRAIAGRACPDMHVLNGFQLAVIADLLLVHGDDSQRHNAASAMHQVATGIDRETLPTARSAADTLSRLAPVDMATSTHAVRSVLRRCLGALRVDYYHHLGPHNFGSKPVSRYTGPNVRSGT